MGEVRKSPHSAMSTIVFSLLGPLRVKCEQEWRAPGPPQQRAVLAMLLLRRRSVVSRAELVDAIWPEEVPRTAVKNLQVHVWRLRRFLQIPIVSRAPGYCLAPEQDQVDLDVFEARVEAARYAARQADLQTASDHYGRALAMWQGPALADLAERGLLIGATTSLDQRRSDVLCERIDVELALARHAELLPELERWTGIYPLDERLRLRHMQVLQHLGRRADAVVVYQRAERRLRDDLGVAPGSELRELVGRLRRYGTQRDLVPGGTSTR